jgi:hypothetical protein
MLALHVTVAVPDPLMLEGDIARQVSPDGTVSDRLTIPLKWFIEVMVIVEVADWVTSTGAGAAPDVVKSRNWNRAFTE